MGCHFLLQRIFPTQGLNPCLLLVFVAQTVKHLPAMQETRVRSLGQEDTLEKESATHSSTPAWKIPWIEEPGGLQSMGLQSQTRLSDFTFTLLLGRQILYPCATWEAPMVFVAGFSRGLSVIYL